MLVPLRARRNVFGGRTIVSALELQSSSSVARGRLAARFLLMSVRLPSGVVPSRMPGKWAWCSFRSFASFSFGVGCLARLTIVLVAAKFENSNVSFASAPNLANWSFRIRNGRLFPFLSVVVSGVWLTIRVLSSRISQTGSRLFLPERGLILFLASWYLARRSKLGGPWRNSMP